ncbi:MAG TPA: hypothetical protein VGL71_08395 [Urbifossiella sp.]
MPGGSIEIGLNEFRRAGHQHPLIFRFIEQRHVISRRRIGEVAAVRGQDQVRFLGADIFPIVDEHGMEPGAETSPRIVLKGRQHAKQNQKDFLDEIGAFGGRDTSPIRPAVDQRRV